jgi:hypothetical protein
LSWFESQISQNLVGYKPNIRKLCSMHFLACSWIFALLLIDHLDPKMDKLFFHHWQCHVFINLHKVTQTCRLRTLWCNTRNFFIYFSWAQKLVCTNQEGEQYMSIILICNMKIFFGCQHIELAPPTLYTRGLISYPTCCEPWNVEKKAYMKRKDLELVWPIFAYYVSRLEAYHQSLWSHWNLVL